MAGGSVRDAFRTVLRDPDHRWVYLASVLGGGGRGLGVANLFALLYLSRVLGCRRRRPTLMYGGADRLLRADAARRGLAVGPDRAEAR